MARARMEQKFQVDRETVEHLIDFLRDAVKSKASDKEILDQAWEILDSEYRKHTDQAFKEMREGKTRAFQDAEQMITDLHSSE